MAWVSSRALVFAAIVCLGAGPGRPAEAQENDVVARVNGTAITRRAVNQVVKSVITSSATVPSGTDLGRLTDDALESLIDLELLYQEARARKIRVGDKEIDAAIGKDRAQFGGDGAFDEALRTSGLSAAALREETRKTLAVNRLLVDVVWRDIEIPDSAVTDFFERNRAEFAGVPQGGAPDAATRKRIVRVLETAERERRQEEFVAALRRTAKIERTDPGRGAPAATPNPDSPP